LRGDLRDYSVNRLLQAVLAENLNGCLTVRREGVSRGLYIKGGMIVYASSTERVDRLGEIFISQGLLTRDEVDQALSQSEPARRLGRILLVEGKITPQDLFLGVSAQVVSILERMRSWRKGEYEFEVLREPSPGTVLLRIPLALYLGTPVKGRYEPAHGRSQSADESQDPDLHEVADAGPPTAHAAEEAQPETVPPGEPGGKELDLTPEEVSGEGFEEDEIEISLEDEDELRGTTSYGEIDLGAAPEDRESAESKVLEEITFQVQELRARLSGEPHRLLGVKENAGKEEIRESYDYFSRLLDPERLPEALPEDIASSARDLYGRITAAFQDMINKPTPASVDRIAPPPGRIAPVAPPPAADSLPPESRPRRSYFRAKKLIEKGNYWQAADALREAVRQQPDEAEYRNLLGICLVQTGRRLHEAEEHIKEAIRLDPGNPDYVTSLGMAYKSGRFYKKARRMFEQALFYDKGHTQARKELRNLPVEEKRADKPKKVWSKLFGK
jgi:tetratricopeptide (TPR) repeat protein